MERLIILSDLWGKRKSEWINNYLKILKNHFEIEFYDCCELGNIDTTEYFEDKLHYQFINGGIDVAVENIQAKEKEIVNVLGFSIGGYIGWKAGINGLKIQHLFAISSTRLRYENRKPSSIIELYYGEYDRFKPDKDWFCKMEVETCIYKNEGHDFYLKNEIVEDICNKIIKHIKPDC